MYTRYSEEEFEMIKLTCRSLHEAIKKRIKGGVTVREFGGNIKVFIVHDGFQFDYVVNDIFDKIQNGFDADKETNEIVAVYKRAVMHKYFE